MTMPASGPLNMGGTSSPVSVAQELGLSLTATISMNQSNVRTLAGVGGSGTQWSMSSLYGKSNRAVISYTYTSNTTNASLNITSIGGYVSGKSDVTVTINSGVYVYSTSTGTPGLSLSGGATGDTLTLVNNGFICGMGGAGQAYIGSGGTGRAGGTALSLGFNTTVNNTNGSAYIGGGGGGGCGYNYYCGGYGGVNPGGGGAGGGNGYGTGALGGGPGASGQNGYYDGDTIGSGGGGRIFPGTGGTGGTVGNGYYGRGGGSGGGGAWGGGANHPGYNGGAGGSGNAVGTNAGNESGGGGGGGWGAKAGNSKNNTGGPGGKAVALNGKSITWVSGNTTRVYGAVS